MIEVEQELHLAALISLSTLLPERRACLWQSVLNSLSLAWLLNFSFPSLPGSDTVGLGEVGRGMSWFCDDTCHQQLFVPFVELFIPQVKLLIFNFVQQMPGKQIEMEFETLGLEP